MKLNRRISDSLPFEFEETDISDVILVKPEVFEDNRGYFIETYVEKDFRKAGIENSFIQDNHSKSKHGVLRGLHFQKNPYSQAKIVRCFKGEIYDVAVDLRESSDTFGEYVSTILSEDNKHQLYVPRGFAHGFLVLSEKADVAYKVDNDYAPDYEGGLIWNDSRVDVDWPLENPVLSKKDKKWPTLEDLREKGETFS